MTLDPETKRALANRVEYYHELGIYDFYRREVGDQTLADAATGETHVGTGVTARAGERSSPENNPAPAADAIELLQQISDDIGDCTRCRLHSGRTNIVFGTGNPHAELMFVGEGPGADEDAQGLPFIGRAGQLLNNMIGAMGLRREDVYIANVVKCRPQVSHSSRSGVRFPGGRHFTTFAM